MDKIARLQRATCAAWGAEFVPMDPSLMVGFAQDFDPSRQPINGLRISPEGTLCGWFIWSGKDWSEADDWFEARCIDCLNDVCPEVLKFLAMPPGWRFLKAGDMKMPGTIRTC